MQHELLPLSNPTVKSPRSEIKANRSNKISPKHIIPYTQNCISKVSYPLALSSNTHVRAHILSEKNRKYTTSCALKCVNIAMHNNYNNQSKNRLIDKVLLTGCPVTIVRLLSRGRQSYGRQAAVPAEHHKCSDREASKTPSEPG